MTNEDRRPPRAAPNLARLFSPRLRAPDTLIQSSTRPTSPANAMVPMTMMPRSRVGATAEVADQPAERRRPRRWRRRPSSACRPWSGARSARPRGSAGRCVAARARRSAARVPTSDTAMAIAAAIRSRITGASASRASSARATSRSSKGTVTSPMVCVVSWPLPAITTTSPGSAAASAVAMARRRSGSTIRSWRGRSAARSYPCSRRR